jgi:hypothetical protein
MPIQLYGNDFMYLEQVGGSVVPWNGGEVPFEHPLAASDCCTFNMALKSGGRSALICDEPVARELMWYKLKGCCPVEGKSYENQFLLRMGVRSDVEGKRPYGGVRKVDSINELKATEKVADKYDEYGVSPPMRPVGYAEYNMSFDGKPICCTALQINGDTRASSFGGAWISLLQRDEKTACDGAFIDTIIKGMADWLAFNHRMLKEAKVTPLECTFDADNYVFHEVKGGYGLGRLDLSTVDFKYNEELMGKKEEFDLSILREFPIASGLRGYAKKVGVKLADILKSTISIKDGEVEIIEIGNNEKEAYNNENGIKTLRVHKERMRWVKNIEKRYIWALDSEKVPKPIPAKFLHKWYGWQ